MTIVTNQINSRKKMSLRFKEHYILYILFFTLGFGKYVIYLPMIVLYYLLKMPTIQFSRLNTNFIILSFLYIFFLISTFSIGYDRMTLEKPLIRLISIIIFIVLGGFVFHYQKFEIKLKLIWFFLFGLFIDYFSIVVYSFLTNPLLYGYGKLLSPFTGKELNSPGVSNALAIIFTYFYYFAMYERKNLTLKLASFIMIILALLSAVFLGGRTFFLMAILTVTFYTMVHISFKNLFYLLLTLSVVGFVGICFVFNNEYFIYYLDFMMNRFDNGLESNRFLHYSNGLSSFLDYPFGGFTVSSSIEDTEWFHNIFLDTARVSGWIPVVFFLLALIYTAKFLMYKNKEDNYTILVLLSIIVFLIMQQDVVLEGEFKSIVILFFASYCLLDSKKKKNNAGAV